MNKFVGNSDEFRIEGSRLVVRLGMTVDEVLRATWKSGHKIELSRSAREMDIVGTGLRFGRDALDRVEFIELSWNEAELVFMGATVLGVSQWKAVESMRSQLPTGTTIVDTAGGVACPDLRFAIWSSNWGEADEPVMAASIHVEGYFDEQSTM